LTSKVRPQIWMEYFNLKSKQSAIAGISRIDG
jgi:hypothetical protein